MPAFLRLLGKALFWYAVAMVAVFCLWFALATPTCLSQFTDHATLPNGMVLKREFNFTRYGRDAMFASDRRTPLAREIEAICFNDRFVKVLSCQRTYSGLYDRATSSRVRRDDQGEYDRLLRYTGLTAGHGCNGYYTGMIGPELLYDGNRAPFLPPCAWRNPANTTLKLRDWFDRLCDDDPFFRSTIPALPASPHRPH